MMNFIEKIVAAGLNEENPIVGISENEILEVEHSQGVKLPGVYRKFLQECGKSAGLFARDLDFFYPTIKILKKDLKEMQEDALKEDGIKIHVPENIFVFGAYLGHQYHYFYCDDVNDPPVYSIDDSGNNPSLISETFTQYMDEIIVEYKEFFYRG